MIKKEPEKAVSSASQHTAKVIDSHLDKSNHPDNENTAPATKKKKEINGPKGLEPTRYGDWEKAGRCIDF